MCEQDNRTAGGVMTVTPTIPGGSESPPPNVVELAKRITSRVHSYKTIDLLCSSIKTCSNQDTNSIKYL